MASFRNSLKSLLWDDGVGHQVVIGKPTVTSDGAEIVQFGLKEVGRWTEVEAADMVTWLRMCGYIVVDERGVPDDGTALWERPVPEEWWDHSEWMYVRPKP